MNVNPKSLLVFMFVFPYMLLARDLQPEVEYAMANGAMVNINVKVRDDIGNAVSNASICVAMDMPTEECCVYGKSDIDGHLVVSGKTNGNRITIIVGKDGYYGSKKEMTYVQIGKEHSVQDGKWQPYGADEIIVLRKIRHPRKMITNTTYLDVPATNVWIGFDLENTSFVKPFGKGEISDLEIKAEWDGLPPWKSDFCRGELRVVGAYAGGYYAPNVDVSQFQYTYSANANAILETKNVNIVNRNGNFYKTNVPFPSDSSLVFRTRCKTDQTGRLLSANYGRIVNFDISPGKRGLPKLTLFYSFNPTSNDTNLEDIETANMSRNFIRQCEPPSEDKVY